MGRIDMQLRGDAAGVSKFIRAASNTPDRTYEIALDDLREALLGPGISKTPTSVGASDPSRRDLYLNMYSLQSAAAYTLLAGKLTFTSTASDQALLTAAPFDFSSLVALLTLSPFVLSGADAANRALLETVQAAAWGARYAEWSADEGLTQAGRDAGKENFSTRWISDRATLLDALVQRNTRDTDNGIVVADSNLPTAHAYEFQFYDGAPRPSEVLPPLQILLAARQPFAPLPVQRIAFGDDTDNLVEGANYRLGDDLFGGRR